MQRKWLTVSAIQFLKLTTTLPDFTIQYYQLNTQSNYQKIDIYLTKDMVSIFLCKYIGNKPVFSLFYNRI